MSHSSAPVWEKDRYTDFFGNPIRRDCQRETGFWPLLSPSAINSAGATVVFTGLAKLEFGDDFYNLDLLVGPVAGTGALLYFKKDEVKKLNEVFSNAVENKCIDTNPKQGTFQSMQKYGQAAADMREQYKSGLYSDFLWLAGGIGLLCASSGFVGANASSIFVARSVSDVSSYRRFNKIAEGEWAIVDWPHPEPVPG